MEPLLEPGRIAFYINLSLAENAEILSCFEQFVKQSVFINTTYGKPPESFQEQTGAIVEKFTQDFMQMTESPLGSTVSKLRLILKLATHEYVGKLAAKKAESLDEDDLALLRAPEERELEDWELDRLRERQELLNLQSDEVRRFFFDCCGDPSPQMEYPVLTIGDIKSEFDVPGIPIAGPSSGYYFLTLTNILALDHESGHAMHISLGIGACCVKFLEEYYQHPFLKELMFSGCDQLKLKVEQKITEFLQGLQGDDLKRFSDDIRRHFALHPDGENRLTSSRLDPLIFEISDDTDEQGKFASELAHKLSLTVIGKLWNNCPEEIFNIIGVQLVDGILVGSTLSDLDVSLEKQTSVRWPYFLFDKSGQPIYRTYSGNSEPLTFAVFSEDDLKLTAENTIPTTEELETWYNNIVAFACATKVGLPTENAWKTLIELHRTVGKR
ncbi:hypothetical protein FACS189472_11310 [Alphaproteobacteria bacterium]|nr:hypothetical protein FACS189472_11310 [Alphaproteobacteria bacterium]